MINKLRMYFVIKLNLLHYNKYLKNNNNKKKKKKIKRNLMNLSNFIFLIFNFFLSSN